MNKKRFCLMAVIALLGCCGLGRADKVIRWWQPYADDQYTLGLWHLDDVTNYSTTFGDDDSANPYRSNTGVRPTWSTNVEASGAGLGSGTGKFGNALNSWTYGSAHLVANDANDMEYTNAFTIEAWIKPASDDLSGTHGIVIKGDPAAAGWAFGLDSGTLWARVQTYQNWTLYGNATLQAGTWYHVAMTYQADYAEGWKDRIAFYINGVLDAAFTYPDFDGDVAHSTLPLVIGVGERSNNMNFLGSIDEVRYSKIARQYSGLVCNGNILDADINEDCRVNLKDLALLACNLMICSNADDPACIKP